MKITVVRLVRPLGPEKLKQGQAMNARPPAVGDEGIVVDWCIDGCRVEFIDRNGQSVWAGWLASGDVIVMDR